MLQALASYRRYRDYALSPHFGGGKTWPRTWAAFEVLWDHYPRLFSLYYRWLQYRGLVPADDE